MNEDVFPPENWGIFQCCVNLCSYIPQRDPGSPKMRMVSWNLARRWWRTPEGIGKGNSFEQRPKPWHDIPYGGVSAYGIVAQISSRTSWFPRRMLHCMCFSIVLCRLTCRRHGSWAGFKHIHHMFEELHEHIQKTKYVPQRDRTPVMDQTGMSKFEDWTQEMNYGKAVPIGAKMAPFADQKWDVCGGYSDDMFKDRDLREEMAQRTRRWSNVLRHKIGQSGAAVGCDETGWVSVESFIRNDHCWSTGQQERAYDRASRSRAAPRHAAL